MAFTQQSATLKNLRVMMTNGLALNATNLSIKRNPVYAEKKPGQALVPSQVFMGENLPDISIELYFDEVANFASILPNQAITTFDVISPLDANESIFAAEFFAKFPPSSMVFGAPDTTLDGEKLGMLKFDIQCNVLNPGADGGYPVTAPIGGGA